ncbi:hypothetical protein Gohar_001279 [Gossypium harknessii]|uniref:Uncharacterized protein n=1 Tax=Gossypium harknessii TaxID=34285 RepID=A0A7J9I416_9ROSI|nr:hypothetical protein [Gossypium harknessii]
MSGDKNLLTPCSCSSHGNVTMLNFTDAALIGLCLLNLSSFSSRQASRIIGANLISYSNNNLTGPIPSSGQLTTFPASRYENNLGLRGIPLPHEF